ncbi:uncharacterized protein LOC132731421 isoform X2 [Ruditapes philippinarum]|uniref:uncharacterized protein LOC132731421 isoform X2 n=1 Tax=Ruditapes philippinarum TaxID=129788 RepID=UPI00295B202D|nr:uncharacterized protein LOC132731421 isoform X2 [Ruditapes philippinarum]
MLTRKRCQNRSKEKRGIKVILEKLCLQMRAKDEKYHCLLATDSFTILEAQHFGRGVKTGVKNKEKRGIKVILEKLCLQMRAKDEKYHCLLATDSFTILEAQHFGIN